MATTKTRRELVVQALAILRVTPANQAPSDEDAQAADAYVDGLIERLQQLEIVYIDNVEQIDPSIFQLVAVLLANAAKDEFGSPNIDAATAIDELRQMGRTGPTYEPLIVDYF